MQMNDTILIASDHAGLALKKFLISELDKIGIKLIDLGCYEETSCDYPEFAQALCHEITFGQAQMGILICGTGLGMSMTANRFKGIRAALCTTEFHARMSKAHNNANVLVLGGRVTGTELALSITKERLTTSFEGGRHQRRVDLMDK